MIHFLENSNYLTYNQVSASPLPDQWKHFRLWNKSCVWIYLQSNLHTIYNKIQKVYVIHLPSYLKRIHRKSISACQQYLKVVFGMHFLNQEWLQHTRNCFMNSDKWSYLGTLPLYLFQHFSENSWLTSSNTL